MSEFPREAAWQESYQRVSRILPVLTKKELDILADVADEFRKKTAFTDGISPLSEKEMMAMIDHAMDQADRGEVETLEETLADTDEAFGL